MTNLMHNFLNTFIMILYMYVVSDRPVHNTGRSLTESVDTRCYGNTLRTGDADLPFYVTTVQDG